MLRQLHFGTASGVDSAAKAVANDRQRSRAADARALQLISLCVCACVCRSVYRAISASHKRINQLFVASFDVFVVAIIASVVAVVVAA